MGRRRRRSESNQIQACKRSSSSSISSISNDEQQVRSTKRRLFMTIGFAAVAVIHAGHTIFQNAENRNHRHEELAEGRMTEEEARKLRARARLKDLGAIVIVAIGVHSAYAEVKEAEEMKELYREAEERKAKHFEKGYRKSKRGRKKSSLNVR